MTTRKPSLVFDFDTDDFVTYTLTRETPHGVFRAVVRRDMCPNEPDHDAGCPVFRLTGRPSGDFPVFGDHWWRNDGLEIDMADAIDRAEQATGCPADAVELIDRWLRAFHGGGAVMVSSTMHQGGDDYIAYDTRAMRQSWGLTGDALDTSHATGGDWQAYIDGDVYTILVERAIGFNEDGDPAEWEWEDCVGGYYGDDWTAEAALDMLNEVIEAKAGAMLPTDA